MNKDVMKGKWKQVRGQVRIWWDKLTDNDLDRIGGNFEMLVGLLQQKYGYTRQRAADEIEKRVNSLKASLK